VATPTARKWAYWAIGARRPVRTPRSAYAQVATEFGVTEEVVRRMCGPIGTSIIRFAERVAFLRAKLDAAGLAPVRVNHIDIPNKDADTDERRELRSCILCEQFLDDDDPGGEAIDEEDCSQRGHICKSCQTLRDRM
jgi:hypothetical protein